MTNWSTDGPTPPPCDPEVFKRGDVVAVLNGRSNAIERWVKKIAEITGARVDWQYTGGRAMVRHLGDAESRARVVAAITALAPTLAGTLLRLHAAAERPEGSDHG